MISIDEESLNRIEKALQKHKCKLPDYENMHFLIGFISGILLYKKQVKMGIIKRIKIEDINDD